MIVVKSSVSVALALVTLAACVATSSDNMKNSAARLERGADAFARNTRGQFRDAPDFADHARDFRETVDHAGDREVILAYEQLWRSYQTLRYEVKRSDSQQAKGDLQPVTEAFRDVVRGISGYADADTALYARGGFQHDPYYDP